MADAGFRLTVEGEKEFRRAISDVNAILKLNQAEMKRVVAEYNAGEKSMESMAAKQKDLSGVIDRQTTAVEQMEDELARLTETYGENDKGVIKMRTELEKAYTSLSSMKQEFQNNAEAIAKATEESKGFEVTLGDVEAQIAAFEAEIKAADAAMSKGAGTMGVFGKTSEDTEKRVGDLQKKSELLSQEMQQQEKKLALLNEEMQEAVKLYGNQSKEVAEYRTRIAETSAQMHTLTSRIEANNKEIDNAKDPATNLGDIFGDIADTVGIQIPDGLSKMVSGIDTGTAALGGMLAAATKIVTTTVEATKDVSMTADEIKRLAAQTGLSTDQIQELQHVGKMTNMTIDQLSDVLKDLKKNIYDANSGSADLAEAFAKLGVETQSCNTDVDSMYATLSSLDSEQLIDLFAEMESRIRGTSKEFIVGSDAIKKYGDGKQYIDSIYNAIKAGEDPTGALTKQMNDLVNGFAGTEAVSRDAYDVFLDVIEAMRTMENETDQNAIAQKLLGGSAKELNELIAIGKEGIEQYSEEANDMGLVLSSDVLNSLDQTANGFRKVEEAMNGVKTNSEGILAGLFTKDWGVAGESLSNLWKSVKSILGIGYANGTYSHPGGYAVVGERGPEIVDLPAGSRVYRNGEGPEAGTVHNYNITIPAKDIREFNDIVRIAQSARVRERMR